MVRNLLRLLHKEYSGLHEAAFLLAISSFASQLLALLRDRLLAHTFGASRELDVYYAAFRIPDIMYVTLGSFVSVTVLIPFITEKLADNRRAEAYKFVNSILTPFLFLMAIVVPIVILAMPVLATYIAPGFDATAQADLVLLSRILMLSPLLLGLSNLVSAITQASHRFFIYALSPLFYNLGIILGIVGFYPVMGLSGLAVGVALGALLHFAIQLPSLVRLGYYPIPLFRFAWQEIKEVTLVSVPRTVTLAANQLALLVLVAQASKMSDGSIAIFNLSLNLQSVPLALVGVSYSVAAFPSLSRIFSAGDRQQFIDQMATTMRHIIFWSVTATIFFIVLRAQIVRVILGSGDFNWVHTRLTAAALALFAVSVMAQSLALLFVRAYYAAGNTARPLVITLSSAAGIILAATGLRATFYEYPLWHYFVEAILRVNDVPGTDVLMLPLAYTVGLTASLIIFWIMFQRDFGRFSRGVYLALGQSVAASVAGGAAAYELLNVLAWQLDLNTFNGVLLQGVTAGLGGVIVWYLVLYVLDSNELKAMTALLRRKFWDRTPIAPDQTGL